MIDHIWLAHFPKITYARHKKVAALFLNSISFAQIEFDDLYKVGFEPEIAHELITWRDNNPWEKIKKQLEDADVQAIDIDDPLYPPLLKQINDPPSVIFFRGNLLPPNQLAVGVVGTRRHTLYGKSVCIDLSTELAKRRIAIVSGLALGIDSFAHQAALDNNGLTVAVLGCGIDAATIYPRSHKNLADKIIQSGGCLISEYPPGTQPTSYSFPARNRIIAGLAQGTLVIEAPTQSGSLITARRALDYNREVMAVPHPINSQMGAGGNELIKRGAALITSAEDVCEALNWQCLLPKTKTTPIDQNTPESQVLTLFSDQATHIEDIAKISGLPSDKIMAYLTILEMRGSVHNLGGGYYTKK